MVKEAIAEALHEQRGALRDLVVEDVLEDMALVTAMREPDTEERVTREEIFAVLEGKE